AHSLAVSARWKPSALDHCDFMRHLRVVAIVAYLVYARPGHDFARFVLVRHALLPVRLAFAGSGLSGFRHRDGNGLLAALHLASGPALQCAALMLVHHLLDLAFLPHGSHKSTSTRL